MDAIMFKVTTAPKSATKVPADTSVFVPVLPEAVPMFAQVLKPAFLEDATTGLRRKSCFKVPDVVVAPQQATGGSQRVQISQVSDLHSSVILFRISGEPSNWICRKIWSFVPTEGGGGLPIPNFDSIFPRVFLLQNGRGSPVPTNKITKNHIQKSSVTPKV